MNRFQEIKMNSIDENYSDFYKKGSDIYRLYPTEFVVRTFLANYPDLSFNPPRNGKVLDLGFGDGRNTIFLCDQGYDVYGCEISEDIVHITKNRLNHLNLDAELGVGWNHDIPYPNDYFDVVLGCHVIYYCTQSTDFNDNIKELSRVIKKNGYLVGSLLNQDSYLLNDALPTEEEGHFIATHDPYNNRNGCKFRAFRNIEEIEEVLSKYFSNFSFGIANNNWYGIDERVFWMVCQKK